MRDPWPKDKIMEHPSLHHPKMFQIHVLWQPAAAPAVEQGSSCSFQTSQTTAAKVRKYISSWKKWYASLCILGGSLQVLPCSGGDCPTNCVWSGWSDWTQCSRPDPKVPDCLQSRERKIKQFPKGGGRKCDGDSSERRFCLSSDCLGKPWYDITSFD